MARWDEIHWVRTSADIPKNDFLNFSAEELVVRYPKIPLKDVILQRHVFFPRKFPIPPEYKDSFARYSRNLIVRSLSELKDSIFNEVGLEEIRRQYPQFGYEDIRREKAVREVRALEARVQKNLRNPGPLNDQRVVVDARNALRVIGEFEPASGELLESKARLQTISDNMAKRQ